MTDTELMRLAVEQAKIAYSIGETPVGAVIARNGEVVSAAYNSRETGKNALYHAEVKAIDEACRILGGWRLFMCDMYVTLEPCPMCAGAIINSRIKRVFYGARDEKAGAFGTLFDINSLGLNHRPEITAGLLGDECSSLLSDFFKKLRAEKK